MDMHSGWRCVRLRWRQLGKEKQMRHDAHVEALIDEWHDDHEATDQLHERLGLSRDEYSEWVHGQGLPKGYRPPPLKEKKLTNTNPTTTAAVAEPQRDPRLDTDNYIDLSELRGDWQYLLELRRQRALLDEAIKVYEAKFKTPVEAVTGAIGFKVDGLPAATWKKDGTFPAAKYAAANPHIAAAYQTTKTVFDVDKFKEHRRDEYDLWRAPSMKYAK